MELKNNLYLHGGVPVIDMCQKYGTPVYIYDGNIIEKRYKELNSAFPDLKLKLKYACKALTNPNVLKFIQKLGAGLDTVSIGEVILGLESGYAPEDIIFTPNCVSFEEIKQAVELGVIINIDNLSILEQFGSEYGDSVPVCVRINPHIMAGGNANISTGHIDSKFGISIYQLRHIERIAKSTNIKINGLHMHTGSDILDVNVFLQGAEILLDAAKTFKDLEFMNFGSGFKVAYKNDDISTDIKELGKKLSKRFKEFCSEYGRELELWFEPGKYIVSESGIFCVQTNVVKHTTATVFAGVNSGFNHLLRPMFYNAFHQIINISNPIGKDRIYTVAGYICETDTFASDRKLKEVREGDFLAFLNAGAYGFAMSSNYNSRLRPAEVFVYKGKDHLIRKREEMEDLTRNVVDLKGAF
ncbi:MAG: diaminopimelate decarboxylase [Chitinophagaceae bacterium]|nr:MAG: diaminopimelate decarboxylase [Chitinophagaceae bacterium]